MQAEATHLTHLISESAHLMGTTPNLSDAVKKDEVFTISTAQNLEKNTASDAPETHLMFTRPEVKEF